MRKPMHIIWYRGRKKYSGLLDKLMEIRFRSADRSKNTYAF